MTAVRNDPATREERSKRNRENRLKGQLSQLSPGDRRSNEYEAWRQAVFNRDDRRCQSCGSTENLHAHHTQRYDEEWIDNPLNIDIDNGQTLCRSCHGKQHRA
jgi:5-methylcytosine-specific restriction endonuclease McrA